MTESQIVCHECDDELDHCHEVLVMHLDGSIECADLQCINEVDSHEWAASCLDLRWPCDCSRVGHAQPLAA